MRDMRGISEQLLDYQPVSVALSHYSHRPLAPVVLFVASPNPKCRWLFVPFQLELDHRKRANHWHGRCNSLSVHVSHSEDCVMLYWAAVFFVIALLAAIFGFGGLAASAAGVAKVLFFVFLIFALVSFLFGRRSAA